MAKKKNNVLKKALDSLLGEETHAVSEKAYFEKLALNLGDKVVPHGKDVPRAGQTGEVTTLDNKKFEVGINFSYKNPKRFYSFGKYPVSQLKLVERGVQCVACRMFLNSNIIEKFELFSPLNMPGVESINPPYMKTTINLCPDCKKVLDAYAEGKRTFIERLIKAERET